MDNDIDIFAEDPDEEFIEEPMGDGDFDMEAEYANTDPPAPEADAQVYVTVLGVVKLDVESLTSEYTKYGLMNRLLFIANYCPQLKTDALKLLMEHVIKNTQNVRMFDIASKLLENDKNNPNSSKDSGKATEIDYNWAEQMRMKASSRLDNCLADFKRQKDEAVKESIRRSLDDLFIQYVQMGELNEAIKLFGRGLREYCTAPHFYIQMLISWINVIIYADQWSRLSSLLSQAERAILEIMERDSLATTSSAHNPSIQSKAPISKSYKDLVDSSRAKIATATGLAKMYEKNFRQAAEKFITIDVDVLNYNEMVSSTDIAIYGILCALATFTRAELKERLLSNNVFRKALESEPKLIDLLQKFCRSQFGQVEDILNDLKDQFLLNIFIAPHVQQLYHSIRQSAIVQYFEPYMTADINQMAAEFRTSLQEMEAELITLIEKGSLKARIDSFNKVIHARISDNRLQIYNRAVNLEKELYNRIISILLRSSLQSCKLMEK